MQRSDPVNPRYEVVFVDFGNREALGGDRVRAMEPSLAAVPPQAQLCTLAYLKARALLAGLDLKYPVIAALAFP